VCEILDNSITFGKGQNSGGSILGAVKDSVINVGATAALGAAAGALGGKVATLKPYTPSTEEINYQLRDIFVKAGFKDQLPDYIKNKGDDVVSAVKKSSRLIKSDIALNEKINEASLLYSIAEQASDTDFKGEKVQNALKKFFHLKNPPENGYTKEGAKKALKERTEKILNTSVKINKQFNTLQDDFIKNEAVLNDGKIQELAQSGAKHLRNREIIGAGIAIGVIGAFVLNILNTYGVIGKKKSAAAQSQAAGNGGASTASQAQ